MSDMEILPWQSERWNQVLGMRTRMPHALLLQGVKGIGKLDFASKFSQALLCEQPLAHGVACQTCQSCNWFLQGHHPDFRLLEPEDAELASEDEGGGAAKTGKKSQISIDQVRDLADFFGLSSHRAGYRVVLLHPAEALNVASANALLKMLEEPPPNVIFLLVTHHPRFLLPTIRSRCNIVGMPVPKADVAASWLASRGIDRAAERLAYAGGAPLDAMVEGDLLGKRMTGLFSQLSMGEKMDPFAASALCVREGMEDVVNAMQKWIYDIASLKLLGQSRYHVSLTQSLQALAKRVDLGKLMDFQRVLDQARRHARHPLNPDLQLESLMIQYCQMFNVKT